MSEQVRREVRELVDAFGPPGPGLAALAVAGLPDRGRRTAPRWAVAAAAALVAATGLVFWAAHGAASRVGTAPAGVGDLERRPLAAIPLIPPACLVDGHRAKVVLLSGGVQFVSGSRVPMDRMMTVEFAYQDPDTISVTAGAGVSGPVVVRGRRLDGSGTMWLALAPASPTKSELALVAGPQRHWDVTIQGSVAGCYSIQFDGAGFSEQAVVSLFPVVGPRIVLPPGSWPALRKVQPGQVRATVGAAGTGVGPVLLPSAAGANWEAEVTTGAAGFVVRYTDPTGTRSVVVEVPSADPPPGARQAQVQPAFRGDARSVYLVANSSDPHDSRFLLWHEPGTYDRVDPAYPGVPYELSATGLTDAEFWQIADSLG
jgi:hypothetical protein